jgi:23S rRNA pseudouridine1911/1915/1917 synthase
MELAVNPNDPVNLRKSTDTVPDADPDAGFEDGDEAEGGFEGFAPISLKLSPEDRGERLDKALSRMVTQFSRSRIQQWIESGHVTVDGAAAKGKAMVLGGEAVLIEPQPAPEDHAFQAEDIPLSIVHEDAAILVLDKPNGLVVHPAAGNWSGTILNGLLHRVPGIAGVPRAGIVHRLDKDTTGLMVVAKTLEAQTDLVRQLQARTVKREYLALVWGQPRIAGKVDASIGRHPRDRVKMAVSENLTAKPAVTHYERLATGVLDDKLVSLVRCQLETGRTHQIRVHMQSLGFPLVGDTLYGKQHLAAYFPRQALHAFRLGLIHPSSREEMDWEAPLPDDMAALLARANIVLPEL